jgi:hypothetical protein
MKWMSFILLLFFANLSVISQQQPRLQNPDAETNCELIKNGAFLNREASGQTTRGYRIVFSGKYAIEYLDGGKYYVKSEITFVNSCEYTSKVVEVTKPNFSVKIGDTFRTKIVETSTESGLIKIEVIINGTTNVVILQREVR